MIGWSLIASRGKSWRFPQSSCWDDVSRARLRLGSLEMECPEMTLMCQCNEIDLYIDLSWAWFVNSHYFQPFTDKLFWGVSWLGTIGVFPPPVDRFQIIYFVFWRNIPSTSSVLADVSVCGLQIEWLLMAVADQAPLLPALCVQH